MRVQRTIFVKRRLKRYINEHSLCQGQSGKEICFLFILKKSIQNVKSVKVH